MLSPLKMVAHCLKALSECRGQVSFADHAGSGMIGKRYQAIWSKVWSSKSQLAHNGEV